jgi:hypothetical protein
MQRAKATRGPHLASPVLAAIAAIAAITVAGCTAGSSNDAAPAKSSPPPRATAKPCAIQETPSHQGMLTPGDVWPTAGGGGQSEQVTKLDANACKATSSASPAYVAPNCSVQDFPWYPVDDQDRVLAQLGVQRIRATKVVSPQNERIRETVLEFAAGTDPGLATIKGFAASCGKVDSQDGQGTWANVRGRPTALVAVDRFLVVVEFEAGNLDRSAQSTIVQKAQNATNQIQ